MSSFPDLSFMSFIATQAALKAGDILRKGFGSPSQITAKPGRQNIVTQFDHASEEAIISLIHQHFPTHSIVAEERGVIKNESDFTWIIDPLDGTTNFARQIPFFTISIAVYQGNKGICGVIFQPITQEMFVAQQGKGAYLNGTAIRVSRIARLEEAIIGGGLPYDVTENSIPYLEHLTHFTRLGIILRNLGSAALGMAYVAAGKLDGFWMDHLHPWDLAAGKLLIEEAGGIVTRYDGQPNTVLAAESVLASNEILYRQMLDKIRKSM